MVDQRVTKESPVVTGLAPKEERSAAAAVTMIALAIFQRRNELARKAGLEDQEPVLEPERVKHRGQPRRG